MNVDVKTSGIEYILEDSRDSLKQRAKELRAEANTNVTVGDLLIYGILALTPGIVVGAKDQLMNPTNVGVQTAVTVDSVMQLSMILASGVVDIKKKLPDGKGGNLKLSTSILPKIADLYDAIAEKVGK